MTPNPSTRKEGPSMPKRYFRLAPFAAALIFLVGLSFGPRTSQAQEKPASEEPAAGPADPFDQQVFQWAADCRDAVEAKFQTLLETGALTEPQLFDTFYIPIPDTYPQKFHTQYDARLDETIQGILDDFLKKDDRLVFVVAVDRNGYLPTHNSRYSLPLTGDREQDILHNRAKRLFNDRTGLAAARNARPYLLQQYNRDTGEAMFDLSVPVFVRDRHWGAVRFGYSNP